MTLHFPTSLINMLLTGLLFIATPAYADSDLSLMQSYNLFINDILVNESTDSRTKAQLQDMLFEQGLDKHLRYDLGVSRTARIKMYSSVGLQLRTEMTYLQFKMAF